MKKVVGKKQSDAGVVRVHLPWIEQQIKNGVRHEAIVEHFSGMGFPMNVVSFRTSLVRERAKVKEAEKKAREAAAAAGVEYQPPTAIPENQPVLNSEKPTVPEKPLEKPATNSGPYIGQRPKDMRQDLQNAETVDPERLAKLLGNK